MLLYLILKLLELFLQGLCLGRPKIRCMACVIRSVNVADGNGRGAHVRRRLRGKSLMCRRGIRLGRLLYLCSLCRHFRVGG